LIVLDLFVLLGVVFSGKFINARRKAAASARWPTVPGKVQDVGPPRSGCSMKQLTPGLACERRRQLERF
jgi:hypothetical protein